MLLVEILPSVKFTFDMLVFNIVLKLIYDNGHFSIYVIYLLFV